MTVPCDVLDHDVADVADLLPLVFAEAHDDRVFVAGLAEHRRLRAGDVGADGVRDARRGDAEQRRLRAVDPHRQLGPRVVLAEARIGDARCVGHQVLRAHAPGPWPVEMSSPRISSARRPPPLPWPPERNWLS